MLFSLIKEWTSAWTMACIFLWTTALAVTFPWFPLPFQQVLCIVFDLMRLVTSSKTTMKLLESSLSSIRRIPTFPLLRRKFSCVTNDCHMLQQIGSRHWCKIGNGFLTLVILMPYFTQNHLLSGRAMLLPVMFQIWNVWCVFLLKPPLDLHPTWCLVLCQNVKHSRLIILLRWLCFCWPPFFSCLRLPPPYIWKGMCWIRVWQLLCGPCKWQDCQFSSIFQQC